MFSSNKNYIYKLSLPSSTSKDVIEWFENMHSMNKLEEELVAIIHKYISSKQNVYKNNFVSEIEEQNKNIESVSCTDNFIDNLYNWQESNKAIFRDEKKKMLSV